MQSRSRLRGTLASLVWAAGEIYYACLDDIKIPFGLLCSARTCVMEWVNGLRRTRPIISIRAPKDDAAQSFIHYRSGWPRLITMVIGALF